MKRDLVGLGGSGRTRGVEMGGGVGSETRSVTKTKRKQNR